MKKNANLIVILVLVLIIAIVWLVLHLQPHKGRDMVRENINPKTYILDNGIEVRRWDPKDSKNSSKPPVIAVHGGGADASQWSKVAPKLAESGRTVFAFSWYDHGLSKKLGDDVFSRRSILDIARVELPSVVDHVLDEMPRYKQVDLIGRSMGGLISLSFAATNPDAVRKLAVMSPVVPAEFGGEVIPIDVKPFEPSSPGDAEQQRQLFEPTAPKDVAYEHWMQSNLESPVAIWEATRWTAEVDVRNITAKTFVITADPKLDRITPPAEIIKMAEAMGAKHHTMVGVGHSEGMYLEPYWRDLSGLLVEFLD